ncbi:MAG TPA: Uma2 family endonuclease [Acidimicrobiales bacterium]|jgi:Uma2 family endonuclease|nr:Uma2 family endonuclease [Acidimicrobiales bacterium]
MAVAERSRLAGLARDGVFTWDDLQAMPEDGFRWELVDGQLFVTPAPRLRHQRAIRRLCGVLTAACPGELEVVLSPYDWKISRTTVFEPDLMVVRKDQLDLDQPFTGSPLLVVEVRSPSTAVTDETLKRQQYAQHGAAAYWLVDPGGPVTQAPGPAARASGGSTGGGAATRVPSLTALRLQDGAYVEAASVTGDDAYDADFPFPVTVVPGRLVESRPASGGHRAVGRADPLEAEENKPG